MSKHIKSRSGLTRCPSCRTHVRAGATPSETQCPFCGANVGSAPARAARAAGKGGLLAASLLAISACNGGSASQETTTETVVETDPGGENTNTNTNDDGDDDYESEPDDPVAVEAYGSPPDDRPPEPVPVPAYGVAPPPQP